MVPWSYWKAAQSEDERNRIKKRKYPKTDIENMIKGKIVRLRRNIGRIVDGRKTERKKYNKRRKTTKTCKKQKQIKKTNKWERKQKFILFVFSCLNTSVSNMQKEAHIGVVVRKVVLKNVINVMMLKNLCSHTRLT